MTGQEVATALGISLPLTYYRIRMLKLDPPYKEEDLEKVRNYKAPKVKRKKSQTEPVYNSFTGKYLKEKYPDFTVHKYGSLYSKIYYREKMAEPKTMEEFVEKCLDDSKWSAGNPKWVGKNVQVPKKHSKADYIKSGNKTYYLFDPTGVFDDELVEFYDWVKKAIGGGYSTSYRKALARNNIMLKHFAIDEEAYWKTMDKFFGDYLEFDEN